MDLKRQEIKKKLVQYAVEKELDFPQAERAAEVVSNRLDDNTLKWDIYLTQPKTV